MVTLQATTLIAAPIERCFELSLNLDLELESVDGLAAVDGVTHGQIGPGERVTWRGKQFGIPVTHTTEISAYESPTYFQDRMVRGTFASFVHDHFFRDLGEGRTEMRDVMTFGMPLSIGGVVTERLLVKRRMWRLLVRRNSVIQKHAELATRDERHGKAG